VSDIVHMPSPNFDARDCAISHIILHYTDMPDADAALARLCDPTAKVSAHYLIRRDGQGRCNWLMRRRAPWHAGVSYWRGQTDMNAASIGIELDHDGHDAAGNMAAFPAAQMRALIALVADIVARHALDPRHILGHSDIAPGRKIDPGEAFDWAALARAGFGFWLDDIKIEDVPTLAAGSSVEKGAVAPLQKALAAFGYRIVADGHFGPQTQAVITAFQRHFRPAKITGTADAETQSLIYEYCRLIG
jgi:N-acetyl-anhydromuramyl-L-alanine amidase AmpD